MWCDLLSSCGSMWCSVKHSILMPCDALCCNTMWCRDMMQYSALRCDLMQCNEMQYISIWDVIHCNAVQHDVNSYVICGRRLVQYDAIDVIQCDAMWFSAMQCNAMLYDMMQCCTFHCNTIWCQCNATQCNRCDPVQCKRCNALQCDGIYKRYYISIIFHLQGSVKEQY